MNPIKWLTVLQGVYEPHQDIHMQPFPEGAPSQTYSSALPAQQTASTDRLHPGFPAAGVLQYACQHLHLCALSANSFKGPIQKNDAGSVCCVQQRLRGSHGARHKTESHMHADIVTVVLLHIRCVHCILRALTLAGLGPL